MFPAITAADEPVGIIADTLQCARRAGTTDHPFVDYSGQQLRAWAQDIVTMLGNHGYQVVMIERREGKPFVCDDDYDPSRDI